MKKTLRDLTEKVSLLSDEVLNFAKKNDLQVLERYISYWNPMDFVTRKEVNDFLRKRFGEEKHPVNATPVVKKEKKKEE